MLTTCSSNGLQKIAAMIDCQRGNDSTSVGTGVDCVELASRDLNLHVHLPGLEEIPFLCSHLFPLRTCSLHLGHFADLGYRHIPPAFVVRQTNVTVVPD